MFLLFSSTYFLSFIFFFPRSLIPSRLPSLRPSCISSLHLFFLFFKKEIKQQQLLLPSLWSHHQASTFSSVLPLRSARVPSARAESGFSFAGASLRWRGWLPLGGLQGECKHLACRRRPVMLWPHPHLCFHLSLFWLPLHSLSLESPCAFSARDSVQSRGDIHHIS